MRLLVALGVVFAWVGWTAHRERQAFRVAADGVAAYARGQADLCEELYQMKWGDPK